MGAALRVDDRRADDAVVAGLVTWWRHPRVLAHLDVDPKTLRARMASTPPHLEVPWINIGSAKRPDYRWIAEQIDTWWTEINQWRASNDATTAGASAGATPTRPRALASARPPPPRKPSPARSKTPPPSDDGGSLVMLVRKRISESS